MGDLHSTFDLGEDKHNPYTCQFFASAYGSYFYKGIPLGIPINKDCFVQLYRNNNYMYTVMITQARGWGYTPIDIKQIIVSNENGFAIINAPYPLRRNFRPNSIIDVIDYKNVGQLNNIRGMFIDDGENCNYSKL